MRTFWIAWPLFPALWLGYLIGAHDALWQVLLTGCWSLPVAVVVAWLWVND